MVEKGLYRTTKEADSLDVLCFFKKQRVQNFLQSKSEYWLMHVFSSPIMNPVPNVCHCLFKPKKEIKQHG